MKDGMCFLLLTEAAGPWLSEFLEKCGVYVLVDPVLRGLMLKLFLLVLRCIRGQDCVP